MNTAQPADATRAPARAARAPADESAVEESLWQHAKRLMLARLVAMACDVLDPCIALLQRLRPRTGGAQGPDAQDEEDRSGPRKAGAGGGRDALVRAGAGEGEDRVDAPKPKRRLFAFLIYLNVLLAGGMVGGALAYELLAKLLDRQATESRRIEAAMSKLSKSAASNQKKLDEAQAKRVDAEKKLEDAKKKQIDAEKKLEAALNDTKVAAEKQKKLNEAVKLLESIRGADRLNSVQRSAPASASERRPTKSGNCTLAAGNISALKDCVEDFNR